MLRMLEAQAPAKQTATDTITTLCSRLCSATLLEDRRAAILGLRSFAKDYPASVASGSLRGLIAALAKDADDLDTIKVVLETLLMLFNPDGSSPEASEDISLWLADEFTQRQDNITLVLDLLDSTDFYSRRYALKLLKAISELRPERTQECILSAPLGIPKLVATLDDHRDAVRDVALDLLIDLTQSSTELQKIVAFQNVFDKIFKLIDGDGSIRQGSIVVQDCLTLIANLIQYNASNQLAFRESSCVPRLAALLVNGTEPPQPAKSDEGAWESPHKEKNLFGLLAVLRMFLVRGGMSTGANQDSFHKHGILQLALELSFDHAASVAIRSQALYVCADVIRRNARLQEIFAQTRVAIPDYEHSNQPGGEKLQNGVGVSHVHVVEALLHLILGASSIQMFDARFAACECLKAYFYNHTQTGSHFLNHAVGVHQAGQQKDITNVVTTLTCGPQSFQTADPYRLWFAAVIVFHLLFENADAKRLLMAIVEGDAASGEEIVTCIQLVSSNLVAGLHNGEDERVIIGYLMLLCGWLFEDADAVNDFLGEASSIRALANTAARSATDKPVVRGLCGVLLGIIYEFSTKDSPIPRRELQSILLNSLGRERYLDAITQLRMHPLVREFEVLQQGAATAYSVNIPAILFDSTFIDFLKDNFSRLSRAIDKDPGLEIYQRFEGVDRDVVDAYRGRLEEQTKALEETESRLLFVERQLKEQQINYKQELDEVHIELSRSKSAYGALQSDHDANVAQREAAHSTELHKLEQHQRQQLASLNAQMHQKGRDAVGQVASARQQHEREVAQLRHERALFEEKSKATESSLLTRCAKAEAELEEANKKLDEAQASFSRTCADLDAARDANSSMEQRSISAETSLQSANSELRQAKLILSQTRTELLAAQGTVASMGETVRQKTALAEDIARKMERMEHAAEMTKADLRDARSQSEQHERAAKSTGSALNEARNRLEVAEQKLERAHTDAVERENVQASAQAELNDMLMVLSDLEEKRARDKKRLAELGQEVSDGEAEDDEDNCDEEEDEDEEEEEDGDQDEDDDSEDEDEAADEMPDEIEDEAE